MKITLKIKNIVVTDGSSGLGRALSIEMAARGAKKFVIADLNKARTEETLGIIR